MSQDALLKMEELLNFEDLWDFRELLFSEAPAGCNQTHHDVLSFFEYDSLGEFFADWNKDYENWEWDRQEISHFWQVEYLPAREIYHSLVAKYEWVVDIDYFRQKSPNDFFDFIFRSGLYLSDGSPKKQSLRSVLDYLLAQEIHLGYDLEPYFIEDASILVSAYPPVKSLAAAATQVLQLNPRCNFPLEEYGKLFAQSNNRNLETYLKIGVTHPPIRNRLLYRRISMAISSGKIAQPLNSDSWEFGEWEYVMEVLSWLKLAKTKVSKAKIKSLLRKVFRGNSLSLDVVLQYEFDSLEYEIYQIEKTLEEAASPEELKQERNRLIKLYHPDVGGNNSLAEMINNNYQKRRASFRKVN